MIENITIEKIKCDCCNKSLEKPLFYRNDGSYQENYITYKTLDICFICASRLFKEYASKIDFNVEELKDRYLSLHEKMNKERNEKIETAMKNFRFGELS